MDEHFTPPSRWRSPQGVFMLLAGAVGVYYLLTEHLAHLGQAVPYLFLLACPLMHLAHGHGHHGHEPSKSGSLPEEHPGHR